MIKRQITEKLLLLSTKFPVVTITGPRQSGKTTIAKYVFSNYDYVSLENPDIRLLAVEDPKGFLQNHPDKCIIDEIQQVPELLSYIQTIVDNEKIKGRFILTGSQNLLLSEKVSQSLAGRTAIMRLLPLNCSELRQHHGFDKITYEEHIFKGSYPAIHNDNIKPGDFYPAYLETYIQRDVRKIQNIRNLMTFTTFIKLCAGRNGQIIDLSSLASDAGISINTAKEWISVLEASYIIFMLHPYYKNFSKRLIKTPKLYFYDTGLAAFLLGIENKEQLSTHYLKGGLFENHIILELLKQRYNSGKQTNIYYWRDNKKNEIDCIIDGATPKALEIKSGKTFTKEYLKMEKYWLRTTTFEKDSFSLVYGGDESFSFLGTKILGWRDFCEHLQ
ncbi:MAG: ATP-binding protein [Chlorobi bacterium]|nr:ATP-binding protein [Chlorobiota bacterium]